MVGGMGVFPGSDPGDVLPLQPACYDHTDYSDGDAAATRPAPDADLDELERVNEKARRAAEHLAQLEAERALREVLAAEDFKGVEWRKLAQALVEYGIEVATAWLVTGEMYVHAARRGRGVRDHPDRLDRRQIEDLSHEVLLDGLEFFQEHALRRGRWDPAKGATMKTFFIGGIIGNFSTVFRRWWKSEMNGGSADALDPDENAGSVDVQGHVETMDLLARVTEDMDPQELAIVYMTAAGFDQAEIAVALGLTPRAVEGRLYRLRKGLDAYRADAAGRRIR